jgi:MoaA/NifB/PqqE/SkfB family radical SAM enzyme
MRRTRNFSRSTLPKDEVKRILDAAAQNKVRVVSFTGGEPLLLLDDLVELMRYAGTVGIDYIRTGTNGFLFSNPNHSGFKSRVKRVVEALASTPLRNLWISIDSAVPSVHERMRGLPGVIRGIEKALPIFHDHGIYPSANLGISRNIGGEETNPGRPVSVESEEARESFYLDMRQAFRKFYGFVMDMGFTMVNSCYPMSIAGSEETQGLAPVYSATSEDRLVRFNDVERTLLFRALMEAVETYRSRVRIFSPLSSLYALSNLNGSNGFHAYPCRGGIDFFFIDSRDGNTYPCGYRGLENLGKYWDLNRGTLDLKPSCQRCDWECFRDPSELFGPLLDACSRPIAILKRMPRDRTYLRLWLRDMAYYRACDLFDGRRPPNLFRLVRFCKGSTDPLHGEWS